MTNNNSKPVVLIVDDDASLRELCSIGLQAEGFEVIGATNGQEGLDTAISKLPDLILLDIAMPVMDGLTMLQKLRKVNEYGKHVPVILLTNYSASNEDIIKKVAETGPAHYFVKSDLTIKEAVKKIKSLLGK